MNAFWPEERRSCELCCRRLGAQMCHTQEVLFVCLALHVPGRGSAFTAHKESSFLDADCHLFSQLTFPEKLLGQALCRSSGMEWRMRSRSCPQELIV